MTGVVFQPGPRYPSLSITDDDDMISYGDPAIAWVQATPQARSLHNATIIDLDGLAPWQRLRRELRELLLWPPERCDTAAVIAPVLQTAVYVLSRDRTRVLLMHRDKCVDDIHFGKYLSLGGHVEPGEDVLTCARREVNEESGLTTTDLTLCGTVLWTGFGPRRGDYLCFMFRADSFTGAAHGGNEEGTLEWVPVDNLASRPMWDSDHLWLPMVFDEVARPFFGVMPYNGDEMVSWSFQR